MKKIVIVTLLLITFFTGCNQTPSTTVINNMPTQDDKNEETESVDIKELSQILIYEEPINETLKLGDITVTLNGIIQKPDSTEGLYTYFSEFRDYEEYLPKMTFLFGEHEDRMYEEVINHYRVDAPEIEYWAHLYVPKIGFAKYEIARRPVGEDNIKVEISNEEAKAIADETLSRIGVTELEFDRCLYEEECLQITPEGVLSTPLGDDLYVFYVQKLQGVPVRTALLSQRKKIVTRVGFCPNGISEVWLSLSDYEPYYMIDSCISYEEALEIFKKSIENEESFNGVNINRITFEYTLVDEYIDGNFVTVAVPCWHFYRDIPIWMGRTETDVVVNAITGVATIY